MARTNLEELDNFEDGFEEEVAGQEKREGEQTSQRVHDQVEAGDEIDDAEKDFPDDVAGGVGFKGKDEVRDATDDHEPAEDEGDGDAGYLGNADGDKPSENEEDAEGD